MSGQLNLEAIEQKARRSFNQDGLVYLFLGLLLLLLSIALLNPALSWLAAFSALLIMPASALRRRYTYPRLGYAKFEVQPGVGRGIILFAIVAGIVLLVMAVIGNGRFQPFLPIGFGLVMALAFYFGTSAYGITTLDALIVAMLAVSGPVAVRLFETWRPAAAAQFGASGAIILIIGVVIFGHFVRTVPILDAPEQAGER